MRRKYSNYNKDYFSNEKMFWYTNFLDDNSINEPTKSIFQLANIFGLENKNVLEIGFGKGILACLLINSGANYYGVDYSDFALEELNKTIKYKCQNKSYNAKVGSLVNIDELFPNTQFDLVVFQSTLEHIYIEDIEIFLNKIILQLNAKAKILIGNAQYPTGLHLPGNKNLGSHVTNVNNVFVAELTKELNLYFNQILHIKGYFVFERNDYTEISERIFLKNNIRIEHIEFRENKFLLRNQKRFYLKWHFIRRPLQLFKRILELDNYA